MNTHFLLRHIAVLALTACSLVRAAQSEEILLWPQGAPGSEDKSGSESVRITSSGERVLSSVHKPALTPYLPAAGAASRVAVVIAPGGGHRELWMDHEGHNLARWLSSRGIAAFVLKYRLARETNSTYQVDTHALADTQRALRLVRARAREWNIDPARLGVLGFSAGGELAALAGMRYDGGTENAADAVDRESSKPDFQALIYPGSSRRFEASKDSPPLFIVCGFKDRPDISRGMAELYLKYKDAGVPAELHIYAAAGHGFGVRESNRTAAGNWPARFEEWLADNGFLPHR